MIKKKWKAFNIFLTDHFNYLYIRKKKLLFHFIINFVFVIWSNWFILDNGLREHFYLHLHHNFFFIHSLAHTLLRRRNLLLFRHDLVNISSECCACTKGSIQFTNEFLCWRNYFPFLSYFSISVELHNQNYASK